MFSVNNLLLENEDMVINTAMILAAGRGERLRPLTDTTPKPLIPMGESTLIEHHLHAFRIAHIQRVVINLCYLSEKIEKFLGDGSKYGVEIKYSYESGDALETAGGIRQALDLINANQFLVVNADIRCDIKYDQLTIDKSNNIHLLLVDNPAHNLSGDFALDTKKTPHKLIKKQANIKSYTYSGVGLYRDSVFEKLPIKRQSLLPILEAEIMASGITGELHSGKWHDVGTYERLEKAQLSETSSK